MRGHQALAEAYAVHVLDVYYHYRFRSVEAEVNAGKKPKKGKTKTGKEKQGWVGFLDTTDKWQQRYVPRSDVPFREHDWRLVLLAGIVCFIASFAAVTILRRAQATQGRMRAAWLVTAGTVTGWGIWSTHFIAMLAYDPGFALGYDPTLTGMSCCRRSG